MTQLKALIIKKISDKLHIYGPMTAKEAQSTTDADLVVVLSDYLELQKPERQEEMNLFRNCTQSSKLLELAYSSSDNVKTIGYMLGNTLSQEIKSTDLLLFNGVEYHEGS